jgi:hypothetical protein
VPQSLCSERMAQMTCTLCGREAGCKVCSRCGDVAYCGKKCQTLDWSVHKLTCSDRVAVRDTGDRGKGVFAKQAFMVGDEMIREAPCFTFKMDAQGDVDILDLYIAFERISSAEQLVMRNLENVYGGNGIFDIPGILHTNSVGMHNTMLGGRSSMAGIFARICRINHACNPNARYVWREDLGKEVLFAMRPISKGEEITVTYNGSYANRQERHRDLWNRWKFICSCVTCTEMHTPLQDSCLSEAYDLSHRIPDVAFLNPKRAFEMCERNLRLKRRVKFDTPIDLGICHYDAYQMAVACGKKKKAKMHLQAAYEYGKLHDGPDSPLVAKYAYLLEH